MKEIWKRISRYPDYEISNFGRIKSYMKNKIKFIIGGKDDDGYRIVGLTNNKRRKTEKVHRLVLETFNPIENMNRLQVNHKNGIKDDNIYPENLEWCNQSENEKHAHKIGLKNFKGNKVFSRGCGKDNPFYGRHHSEETKKILREKQKGKDRRSLWWEITKPTGDIIKIRNLKRFCEENKFGYSNVITYSNKNKKVRGYSFRKVLKDE